MLSKPQSESSSIFLDKLSAAFDLPASVFREQSAVDIDDYFCNKGLDCAKNDIHCLIYAASLNPGEHFALASFIAANIDSFNKLNAMQVECILHFLALDLSNILLDAAVIDNTPSNEHVNLILNAMKKLINDVSGEVVNNCPRGNNPTS